MRLEDRAARRLGGVRGEDELDAQPCSGGGESRAVDARLVEPRERVRQGLPLQASLGLVLAPPPDAVVLLGDVDQLEEERESAQDVGLPAARQRRDRVSKRLP
jgi:hypothetical protein